MWQCAGNGKATQSGVCRGDISRKYGGMTQREAARILGLKCGFAVSVQVRKLREKVAGDCEINRAIARLDRKLAAKQR